MPPMLGPVSTTERARPPSSGDRSPVPTVASGLTDSERQLLQSRDLARQYMGLTDYVIYFYAGDITQFVKATGDVCAGAAYKPFPEIEKICLGDKCA